MGLQASEMSLFVGKDSSRITIALMPGKSEVRFGHCDVGHLLNVRPARRRPAPGQVPRRPLVRLRLDSRSETTTASSSTFSSVVEMLTPTSIAGRHQALQLATVEIGQEQFAVAARLSGFETPQSDLQNAANTPPSSPRLFAGPIAGRSGRSHGARRNNLFAGRVGRQSCRCESDGCGEPECSDRHTRSTAAVVATADPAADGTALHRCGPGHQRGPGVWPATNGTGRPAGSSSVRWKIGRDSTLFDRRLLLRVTAPLTGKLAWRLPLHAVTGPAASDAFPWSGRAGSACRPQCEQTNPRATDERPCVRLSGSPNSTPRRAGLLGSGAHPHRVQGHCPCDIRRLWSGTRHSQ